MPRDQGRAQSNVSTVHLLAARAARGRCLLLQRCHLGGARGGGGACERIERATARTGAVVVVSQPWRWRQRSAAARGAKSTLGMGYIHGGYIHTKYAMHGHPKYGLHTRGATHMLSIEGRTYAQGVEYSDPFLFRRTDIG
jgi:hypothetical protein